jgi:defect-in-organelle-trafficking protein DotD
LTSIQAPVSIDRITIYFDGQMKKLLLLLLTSAILASCAGGTYKKPPYNDPSDDATIKLAEAADSVSDSMMQMARVEKVITPPRKDNTLTIPNAYNLQARASVDWSGPIAEVTERVAKAAHFRLRVLGKQPGVPVLISLNVQDESLAEILRNIDYQAGKKAFIHVYPNSQVVELRYAKS